MITFMEGREFRVTLVSAQNLPDIRSHGHMKVYAEVSLNGILETTTKSNVDEQGETNPMWSFVAGYTISEAAMQLPGVNLMVKLLCKRTIGDKLIGEVKIPLKNLFDTTHESADQEKILSYDVKGTPNGVLNISYSFGQKMAVVPDRAPLPSSSGQKILQGLSLGLDVLGLGMNIK
ncbi:hypothetical protein C2S53_006082 [Perilla frutescens var. hirtella]|uniref:C2 domain-containing protein n=1 Tax=Perilla frutescens var. hirtella TaxID=608512 RepID=A0AAD4JFF3_PERFH|nr:hypothetical protein C2S53_006082 [Perilla frutescens var. hirtella]